MRLLENYKFPKLQSGKKYAYLEANMPGSAEQAGLRGGGGGGTRAHSPALLKKYIKEK